MQNGDENLMRLTTLVIQARDLIDQTRARIQAIESCLADRIAAGSAKSKAFYPAFGGHTSDTTLSHGSRKPNS